MITIGICDDDNQFVKELHRVLQDVMQSVSDWQARIYTSGDDIIADISNDLFDCNLLFMDIVMPGKSGLDIARYFYEHHIDTDIIFITSAKEYVYECYRYHSFSYLLKPLSLTDVANELNRYLIESANVSKCLNISIKNVHHRIPLRSILYLESDCRKILVHTPHKDYEYYEKLDTLEKALVPYGFIRCHQSYLVPISKITSYQTGELTIEDFSIPVSSRYKNQIEDLFKNTLQPDIPSNTHLVTKSLSLNQGITGALVCTKGTYLGSIIRFYADKEIVIGRDGTACDVVINLPYISRQHCRIQYNKASNTYEVTDLSHNGTFLLYPDYTNLKGSIESNSQMERITKNKPSCLKPGAALCFGKKDSIYRLI